MKNKIFIIGIVILSSANNKGMGPSQNGEVLVSPRNGSLPSRDLIRTRSCEMNPLKIKLDEDMVPVVLTFSQKKGSPRTGPSPLNPKMPTRDRSTSLSMVPSSMPLDLPK